MSPQLSSAELPDVQQLLRDYEAAQPAIATVVVLWVLNLGIRTFCDYTEPAQGEKEAP
ncbi:MAG TPA: hypothetical protein ACFE0H_16365 [Elainellaceae cyanobacterium]